MRVGPAGAPVGSAFLVSGAQYEQRATAASFDGQQWVVAWEDLRSTGLEVYVARVTTAGVVRDDAGLRLPRDAGEGNSLPAAASDGLGTTLVAYEDRLYGATTRDISFQRLTADGGWLGEVQVTFTDGGSEETPAVAFGAGGYLLAWRAPWADGGILGTRVSPAGVVLDVPPLQLSPPASQPQRPAVAFGATSFLVAWTGSATSSAVFAARVWPDGGVAQAPFQVSNGPATPAPQTPRVTFDGEHFVVAWQHAVPGSQLAVATVHEPTGAVHRLETQADAQNEREVGLVTTSSGTALLASLRFDTASQSNRVSLRSVLSLRPGATCAFPNECATNFCESGACCRTACPGGSCVTGTCGGGSLPDGGATDAGSTTDAGTTTDAGSDPDAGSAIDAGSDPDAGSAADGGLTDAGSEPDAGSPVDGGAPDGGSTADAGSSADAGTPAARNLSVALGCTTAAAGPWAWLAVAWALGRRRALRGARGAPAGTSASSRAR